MTTAPTVVRTGKLTEAQKDIWRFQSLAPKLPIQQLAYRLIITGEFDTEAFARAIAACVAVHEPLRTIYPVRGGWPRAAVLHEDTARADLELRDVPDAEVAKNVFKEVATAPYNLAAGPLLRVVVIRRGPLLHEVLLGVHHICADAWTLKILGKHISRTYASIRRCESPVIAKPRMQAIDYAKWEGAWLRSAQFRTALAWWERNFAAYDLNTIARLPYRATRLPVPYLRTTALSDIFPLELTAALEARARLLRVPLFAAVLAGLKFGIARLTRSSDVALVSVCACRRTQNLNAAGAFRNVIAIRTRLAAARSVHDVVSVATKATFSTLEHQWVPFRFIARRLETTRQFDSRDLLSISFEWSDSPVDLDVQLDGAELVEELSWDRYYYDLSHASEATAAPRWILRSAADLQVLVTRLREGLEVRYVYKTDLLDRDFIVSLRAITRRFFRAFAHRPHTRLAAL